MSVYLALFLIVNRIFKVGLKTHVSSTKHKDLSLEIHCTMSGLMSVGTIWSGNSYSWISTERAVVGDRCGLMFVVISWRTLSR